MYAPKDILLLILFSKYKLVLKDYDNSITIINITVDKYNKDYFPYPELYKDTYFVYPEFLDFVYFFIVLMTILGFLILGIVSL